MSKRPNNYEEFSLGVKRRSKHLFVSQLYECVGEQTIKTTDTLSCVSKIKIHYIFSLSVKFYMVVIRNFNLRLQMMNIVRLRTFDKMPPWLNMKSMKQLVHRA